MRNATETLCSLLDRAAASPDAGLRFVDRAERASSLAWSEVRERARGVCASLRRIGVAPGDRVALVFPTGPEFFDGFFGALLAGAIPVPLYPPVRLGRLEEYDERTARMLQLVRARLVLADPRVRRLLGEPVRAARPALGCRTLADLPRGVPSEPVPLGPADLALVQFTSGTTLDPEPVALTHRAVVTQATLLNDFWPDDATMHHSGVSWLPLYHDMGLVGCAFAALERPATLTLIPPELFVARPAVWLRTISRQRATISPAPNFAYGLCVEKIRDAELEGVDLSCWRVALNGAETVVPAVIRAFGERFARWGFAPEAITPVYGMAEATLAVTFSDPRRPAAVRRFDRDGLAAGGVAHESEGGREIVSVGRPLPGFDLRIVGGRGEDLPVGHVGRVAVRGPSLMREYLDRPERTATVLRNGWLDTGDLGFVFHDELYLCGRAKDVLIRRGRNHAPEEVERTLDGVDGVRTGCAVAVSWLPEGAAGEALLVFVETRRPHGEHGDLARRCGSAILGGTGLQPDSIVLLAPGTLPRTSSGKLRRAETLRRHLHGELRPPAPVNAARMARAVARSALAFARARWSDAAPR